MNTSLDSNSAKALCLCALVDAITGVVELARNGRTDLESRSALLNAIFELQADAPEQLYGQAPRLQDMVEITRGKLANGNAGGDEVIRLAAQVLALSRRLWRDADAGERLLKALEPAIRQRQQLGLLHDYTVHSLAQAYAEGVSPLSTPIRIFGDATYLAQPRIAAQVRALMLAGMRAAVLWRHLGGNGWSLYFRQRHWQRIVAALPERLAALTQP